MFGSLFKDLDRDDLEWILEATLRVIDRGDVDLKHYPPPSDKCIGTLCAIIGWISYGQK